MRKIFESLITIGVAFLSLILTIKWYLQQGEIEPLIGIISASGVLLTALVYRIFPEKKEAAVSGAPIHVEQRENTVEESELSAGQNIVVGKDNTIQQTFITYAGDKKIQHLLTTAGAAVPADFLGRERELTEIRQRLAAGQGTLALVNAEGGMGKTTLAAAYWKRHESQYQYMAWLFCDKGILPAMRLQLQAPLDLTEAMNAVADDPDGQMRLVLARMANLPKDCLLVLDNANEPEHIQDFERYCAGLGWHVLITSRCSKVLTDRNAEYPITSLAPDEARSLFRNNHDEPQNPQFPALLDRFLAAVGHNTLCIEIFSKNLREGAAWGQTLDQLLEKLEQNGLRLGDDSFEVRTHWAQAQRSTVATTDQVIEALYDLDGLAPEERDLLTQCSLLPAESHPPTVWAALLAPDDPRGLKRRMDGLVQKGWLGSDVATYRVSPVVQRIALEREKARLWVLGESLVARLNEIFENEGYHSKNIQTATAFSDLVFGLVEHLGVANEGITMLFDRLWVYFNATGNVSKAMDTAERMSGVCEKYGDKNGLAISYEKLGETHSALGNLPMALTFFEKDIELTKELHEAYPQNVDSKNGLAISYSKLGATHTALGNLPKALTFFEQFNQLEAALHEVYPQNVDFKNGLAISYSKLGATHSALGNLPKALTFFERFDELMIELHEAYPQNVEFKNVLAISYSKLGETHTALGNLPQALTFFEGASSMTRELHESYPQNVSFKNGLAISYSKLGETHTALGNLPKALTFFEERSRLGKELHEAYPQNVDFKNGLAISYSKLGATHSALGNLPKALTFFEQYNQLGKELHKAYPQNVDFKNGLAISYSKLGETHTALGNLPMALTFFEKDIELSKELHEAYPQNVEFKNGLAISYSKLGETHSALGNLPKALTFFEKDIELSKELHEAYPQNVGFKNGLAISCQFLGNTYTALGNLPKALTFFERFNELMKALHEAYPQNVEFKNFLAISYEKLGATHTALGNLPKALTFFEQYNQLEAALHEAYPQNVDFKNGLAISYEKLGETHSALGNLPKALTFFERFNELMKELHEAYPQNVGFKNGLATSYLFLGQFHRDNLNDAASAKTYFQKGYDLYAELVRDFPDYSSFRENYEWVKEALGMD
jgi:tetratricopeptide (TPR) repeat protein